NSGRITRSESGIPTMPARTSSMDSCRVEPRGRKRMNTTSNAAEPEAAADASDDQLNRAIEELRDVLKEEQQRPEAAPRSGGAGSNPNVIMNIPVDVQIVLGSTEMPVSELMALQKGSTVALDRRIGEPVDVV